MTDQLIQASLLSRLLQKLPKEASEDTAVKAGVAAVEAEVSAEQAGDKPQQSYLALTKLGMGKKAAVAGPKPESKEKTTTPAKPGKRSITEMASSTLLKAGFTKS